VYCLVRELASHCPTSLASMQLSEAMLEVLATRAAREHTALWLRSLKELVAGEGQAAHGQGEAALEAFDVAAIALQGAAQPGSDFVFQQQYVQLRAQFLETLLATAALISEVPASEDPKKLVPLIVRLRRHIEMQVVGLAAKVGKLCRRHINMGGRSQALLLALQVCLQTCCHAARLVANSPDWPLQSIPVLQSSLAHPLMTLCSSHLQKLEEASGGILQRAECFEAMLRELSVVPVPVPPFFFSHNQPHRMQVTLGPQSKVPGEPTVIVEGTSFMLQIGGYIAGLSRSASAKVRGTVFTVKTVPMNSGDAAPNNGTIVTRLQLRRPAMSFRGVCLLHLPQGVGMYELQVQGQLEDGHGEYWGSGVECTSIIVRVAPQAAAP